MKLVRELLKVYLIFAAVFFIGRLLFFIIFYERFAEIPFLKHFSHLFMVFVWILLLYLLY